MFADLGLASFPFNLGSVGAAGSSPDSGSVVTTVPDTVTLDGWTYAIELADYRFGPLDTFRDGVVANDEPNDSLFNARGAWARYRFSWHRGADQEVGDLDEVADNFRFDESYGFDPWSKYKLQLLPRARYDEDLLITNSNPLILRAGENLYIADDAALVEITTTTWGSVTGHAGNIQSLATDGINIYIATSSEMEKYVPGDANTTAFSTPVTGNCTKVGFVANRLLLAKANILYEVGSTGALDEVETHFQVGFNWTTIFAIGSRIYVGGYAGVKSELYTLTTDEGGLLVVAQEAAPFPIGEQLLCGLSVGGSCVLGTNKGVRFAQVGADGTLTYGPLIDAPGAVYQLAAESRFVWGTWNDSIGHAQGHKGTFRMDLTTFVDVLQPAYAADISIGSDDYEVVGVERWDDRTWMMTRDRGVYYAQDDGFFEGVETWVNTASLTSGRLFFGTIEPKGLVELEVHHSDLIEGQTVTVTLTNQHGELVGTATQSIAGTDRLTIDLDGTQVIEANVQIEATTPGEGPQIEIYSWRMRAYPSPPATLQWLVPLITHEKVIINDGEGEAFSQSARQVIDRVEALHASRRLVNYLEGGRLYRVRVESFEHRPAKWSENGDAPVGVCIVQLVSA